MTPAVRAVLLLTLFLAIRALEARAQGIVVAPDGPVSTLARAIELAEPGSIITVRPGTYREPTIIVSKSVTIVGEDFPVLDGENERQIMSVTADGVTVTGLEFRNVGVSYVEDRAAIKIEEVSDCMIRGNRIRGAFFGIYLQESEGCVIAGNDIRATGDREVTSGNGIHLWYSKNITVRSNTILGHRDGIYFEFVEDSRVFDNVSEGNLRYGLHFMFSDRCAYRRNVFRNNGAGVAVMYTERVEMVDNEFSDNWGSAAFGLLLKDITDSRIEGNVFNRNTTALYAEGVNRTEVIGNDFTENGRAIKILANAQDNTFSQNNFTGNTFDVVTNSRKTYSTFSGNHWDAYRGYDLDRDGYGDVPFHPVRLFSLLVESTPPSLILLRSVFVRLLDMAERVLPALTPEQLRDDRPVMQPIPREAA